MQICVNVAALFVLVIASMTSLQSTVAQSAAADTVTPAIAPVAVKSPPQPVVSCTPVIVEGDATYCISGRVCSGVGASPFGSLCPKKGDAAIARCWNTHKSYLGASDTCVAPQDAQCVEITTGAWGCVFPDASIPVEVATVQPAVVHVNSAAAATQSAVSLAYNSQASTATMFAASGVTPDEQRTSGDASVTTGASAAVNAVVAVAALVVAAFGIAVAKKRQSDRRQAHSDDSSRNISCVELSTPI